MCDDVLTWYTLSTAVSVNQPLRKAFKAQGRSFVYCQVYNSLVKVLYLSAS